MNFSQYLNQKPVTKQPTGSVLLERSEYDLDKLGNDYYVDVNVMGDWYRYKAKILGYGQPEFATLYGLDDDGNAKGASVFKVRVNDLQN